MAYLLKNAILTQASPYSAEITLTTNGADEDLHKTDSNKIEYLIHGMQAGEIIVIQRWSNYIQEWKNISNSQDDDSFQITKDVAGRSLIDFARTGKIRFAILSGATLSTNIQIDLMS